MASAKNPYTGKALSSLLLSLNGELQGKEQGLLMLAALAEQVEKLTKDLANAQGKISALNQGEHRGRTPAQPDLPPPPRSRSRSTERRLRSRSPSTERGSRDSAKVMCYHGKGCKKQNCKFEHNCLFGEGCTRGLECKFRHTDEEIVGFKAKEQLANVANTTN